MIQVKLLITPNELEFQKKDERFKDFIDCLNNELREPIEIIHEKDNTYSGYYLFFESNYLPNEHYKHVDQKTFLVSVSNPNNNIIKDCNPAGFVALRNYMAKFPLLFGLEKALQYAGMDINRLRYFDYNAVILQEKDGTYKPMVKTVFKYLEIYDKYLKNLQKHQ
ncbi:hypothetical protein [Winogradskyella sp. SYSU M77433]|uniref:hypothetical protein n=1 Tax=Winogradskyella sp. SYSU M77433 TaxID=3042722 RepID=UPI002480D509|nr:hypothetical protein [Winogradskyella sp. SYSU M77433]MDH7913763.1 hypothetical protein [Winogradskyella sp. SYSU M77433]